MPAKATFVKHSIYLSTSGCSEPVVASTEGAASIGLWVTMNLHHAVLDGFDEELESLKHLVGAQPDELG